MKITIALRCWEGTCYSEYKKLTKVIQYLWGAQYPTLTIEVSKNWNSWGNSLNAVHLDMKKPQWNIYLWRTHQWASSNLTQRVQRRLN